MFRFFYFCIAVTVVASVVTCTDDKNCPVCPVEPPPEVSDYNIYISEGGQQGKYLYIYSTRAGAIVDSIEQGWWGHDDFKISFDEKYLFFSEYAHQTIIVDLETLEEVKRYSFGGEIEVSPNGKYLAIQGPRFAVLDATTFETILFDSAVGGGKFDSSGNIFYCLKSGNRIRRYDLANDSVYTDVNWTYNGSVRGSLAQIIPVEGGQKVFMHLRYANNNTEVISYRFDNDSTGFSFRIGSLGTRFALTPDGATLIFTDPLNFESVMPFTSGYVYMADVASDQVTDIVQPPVYIRDGSRARINPVEPVIIPDGKLCFFSAESFVGAIFSIMSVEEKSFIYRDTTLWERQMVPLHISCRKIE